MNFKLFLYNLFLFGISIYFLIQLNLSYQSVAIIYSVLFLHEAGHFYFMKICGYDSVRFMILPLFGAMVFSNTLAISTNDHLKVLLAGPIPGLLIGWLLWSIGLFFNQTILLKIAKYFVIINAFNLLPISILDGGKILEMLFLKTSISKIKFHILSIVFSILLMIYFQNMLFLPLVFLQLLVLYQIFMAFRREGSANVCHDVCNQILVSSRERELEKKINNPDKNLIRIDNSNFPSPMLIYDNISIRSKIISVVMLLIMIFSSFLVFWT